MMHLFTVLITDKTINELQPLNAESIFTNYFPKQYVGNITSIHKLGTNEDASECHMINHPKF